MYRKIKNTGSFQNSWLLVLLAQKSIASFTSIEKRCSAKELLNEAFVEVSHVVRLLKRSSNSQKNDSSGLSWYSARRYSNARHKICDVFYEKTIARRKLSVGTLKILIPPVVLAKNSIGYGESSFQVSFLATWAYQESSVRNIPKTILSCPNKNAVA